MKEYQHTLKDGSYTCCATLQIKDGRAVILLHSMFNQESGATIPLLSGKGTLVIEKVESEELKSRGLLENGQAII